MFSSALKSFTSNINSNYTVSASPSSTSGPWKIYDAKKKSTGKAASIFVFERKSLEVNSNSSSFGKSSNSALKKAYEEVVERLKKEASSLARLRHPSILELVEPLEETRNGGLQFATEAVTASLTGLLAEKDAEETAGGRGSIRRRKDIDIDELEIQKGLLQISKALEFLHENAGLVHGNLTPDAVFVNAKSDWKISGLSFASPPDNSTKPTSISPISLSEVLNLNPRLPRSVQLNLDYTSPDFVMDNNLNVSADLFSLGLIIVALYSSPHISPLQANGSTNSYKRLFTSSSSIPSSSNSYLSTRPMPRDLTNTVLPRLITRRPAQRMTATEFQQSAYFDNVLVSTIRFLDSLPAKTPSEKSQFMRGLGRVLPSFPNSVLEKKVLPALLEEMKDRALLFLVLQNVFGIVKTLPSGPRCFSEKIVPRLREIFVQGYKGPSPDRDPEKEAGLMVVLNNMTNIAGNCSGKEFKDDILPIIHIAIESPTHSLVDSALRSLPVALPILDFSTIKNELFPVIAMVFSKTSSLGIKVRGLEAFVILCGGSADPSADDDLNGMVVARKTSSSSALDKYTMQEKIVPLIKAIKTKEPAVMVAALNVLRRVGIVADREFVASDILPILWTMALGPLLDLKQFQSFMTLIKFLSSRVEEEHTKALQELQGTSRGGRASRNDDFMSFEGVSGFATPKGADNADDDFERLVKGTNGTSSTSTNPMDAGWDTTATNPTKQQSVSSTASKPAMFSWSTPSPTTPTYQPPAVSLKAQPSQASRTATPDLSSFGALTPSTTQFSKPLQPASAFSPPPQPQQASKSSVDWGAASANPWGSTATISAPTTNTSAFTNSSSAFGSVTSSSATPSAFGAMQTSMGSMSLNRPSMPTSNSSSFSLPPPPPASSYSSFQAPPKPSVPSYSAFQSAPSQPSAFTNPPPPQNSAFGGFQSAPQQNNGFGTGQQNGMGVGMGMGMGMQQNGQKKTGLDAFESLL